MPNTKSNEISHPNNFQSLPITRNRSKGTSKNEMTEKSQESSRIFSKLDKQITKQKDRNSKTPELHNIQIIKLPNKLLDASSQMPRSSENCTEGSLGNVSMFFSSAGLSMILSTQASDPSAEASDTKNTLVIIDAY